MLNIHLIRRQIAASAHQSVVLVLCVVLSMITLVSLGGFSRSVHSSFLRDARTLYAADIIIHSHSSISPHLLDSLTALEQQKAIESARVYEFYSVVQAVKNPKRSASGDKKAEETGTNKRELQLADETSRARLSNTESSEGEESLLSSIKAVEPGYPFYGTLELASGRPFHEVLTRGSLVVEQSLLDRLHLKVGDRLRVGSAVLCIRDVVLQEPDRPVNFFALGPRVFVSSVDLPSLDLVGKGSRVDYTILVKVENEKELQRIANQLRDASMKDRERVETYRTAESGVKRFFDNFLFFLNLIGIFTLLLAGIGIQSSLTAFLKEQERTIAIMKAVGSRSRFIIAHYFMVVAVLGSLGTILGISASFLLEKILPDLFRGLIPPNVELTISGGAVAEGLIIGFLVVIFFTALPLLRLKEVKPRAIFGKEEQRTMQSRTTWLTGSSSVIFFILIVLWRIREVKSGIYFVLGMGILILASFLCSEGILRLVKTLHAKNLILRQALKGLFRPGNATRPIIVTLTAALAVIFSITVVEENLNATFVRSYPPDAPNLFFIDIQPGQKDAFARDLAIPAIYYPVIRGTIMAVNKEPIDREAERHKHGDNLAREFNLTYRENLLEDERLVEGQGLFRKDWPEAQVSVLDTVLKMKELKVGDTIAFDIQGIPVDARVSSVRTRTRSALQPFFYFVFPDKVLKDAPQTLFTAVRVEKKQIAALQNRIVSHFPNVSIIDVTETVRVFARVMDRLSSIVRFFALFSVIAGILIIISSVFATRYTRIQEAVYFTILGARGRFVLAVFALENLLIGLASGLIALVLAQTGSWIICRHALDILYKPFLGISTLMIIAMTILVIAVGLGASLAIIRQRPAAFLREQTEE
ncbi:MAG TPA: FtsX-like permease family protein [Nitrospirota bacterium]|nr:FtsX-like permease family protein [Nitrospirota bacterium]